MTLPITVLRTRGPLLAKQWQADGTITDYDSPKHFTVRSAEVPDVRALHALLSRLQRDPRACIIRGQPGAPLQPDQVVQRNLDTFADQPSHLFMIDIDRYQGTVESFIATLPDCFQDATCVWQLSGSHGHPSKAGLRAHLWYWLETPLTCEQAEAWAKHFLPGTDCTVHRTVQVNYTAAPVMADGVVDPVPERLGLIEGLLCDTVVIPPDMPVPEGQARRTRRAERAASMVDPRDKPGVIGALARAHPAAEIVTLFPDHFEAGSKEHRITWRHGGGAKEGIGVADNGTHLFNTHATSPIGDRAVNLFDFVRAHIFGHLDEGIEQDVLDLDITAAPSYKATVEWALSLPSVQEESRSEQAATVAEAVADKKVEEATSETRQERLQKLLAIIANAPDRQRLQRMGRDIAKSKSYDTADINDLANAMARRCKQLASPQPIATVREWLTATAVDGGPVFPHLSNEGTPKLTIENLEALLASNGMQARYNIIGKDTELVGLQHEYSRDNAGSASFAELQSKMAAVSMPNNTAITQSFLLNIGDRNPYNHALEWIESAPWDGTSRIQALADTVEHADGFDERLKVRVLRKWLVQAAAAAAFTGHGLQFRGVLVFQGDQYMGKSRWLESLVPDNPRLACTGRQINPHDKDSVNTAIRHWLVELGELDATFTKADIAALKAWLSNREDIYRRPYAAKDSAFDRRTVCFASVNPKTFLVDNTGSSRFWVIPVKRCQHVHDVNMQQLWAEALHLWRAGEPHWMTDEEMAAITSSNRRHEQPDPVHEMVISRLAWEAAGSPKKPDGAEYGKPAAGGVVWLRLRATDIALRLGYGLAAINQKLLNRVSEALEGAGAQSRLTNKGRLWDVPIAEDDMVGLER